MRSSDRNHHSPLPVLALLICLGVSLGGCSTSQESVERAGESAESSMEIQAVLDAHGDLVKAFEESDVAAFLRLLDKSDDLLIYHPRIQNRLTGLDEIQQGLPAMFEALGQTSWLDVHVGVSIEGDTAWLTSQIVIETSGVEVPFTGRGTEIWVRRGDSLRLAHAHWSDDPEFEGRGFSED